MNMNRAIKFSIYILILLSSGLVHHSYGQDGQFSESIRIIYLIRHAKPDVPDETHFKYDEIKMYYQLYDSNDIILFDKNIVLKQIAEPVPELIFTSMLPRARQTAWHAFGDNQKYVSRTVFNEFGRTMVHIPAVTMSKGTWSTLSRLTWTLGFHKDTESFRDAKRRADLCATILEDLSVEEKVVILVGHGFMNHYIKKSLKKNGWKVLLDDGKENLGAIKLKKIIENL